MLTPLKREEFNKYINFVYALALDPAKSGYPTYTDGIKTRAVLERYIVEKLVKTAKRIDSLLISYKLRLQEINDMPRTSSDIINKRIFKIRLNNRNLSKQKIITYFIFSDKKHYSMTAVIFQYKLFDTIRHLYKSLNFFKAGIFRKMNSVCSQAEEIVLAELIYTL